MLRSKELYLIKFVYEEYVPSRVVRCSIICVLLRDVAKRNFDSSRRRNRPYKNCRKAIVPWPLTRIKDGNAVLITQPWNSIFFQVTIVHISLPIVLRVNPFSLDEMDFLPETVFFWVARFPAHAHTFYSTNPVCRMTI